MLSSPLTRWVAPGLFPQGLGSGTPCAYRRLSLSPSTRLYSRRRQGEVKKEPQESASLSMASNFAFREGLLSVSFLIVRP